MIGDESAEAVLRGLGLGDEDVAAWRAAGLPPAALAEWATDRVARRPEGAHARAVYGAPDVHAFAREAILAALALRPGDRLLEVGCGGGRLLLAALDAGAEATGLDHSEDMVALAREVAPGARVVSGRAENLPFADGDFSAVAMSMVLLFLPEPVSVLAECRRVLMPGGRLAAYTSGPALRGTPAAPEPLASQCFFHASPELAGYARSAGFDAVEVVEDDGGQLLLGIRPPHA